MTGMGHVGHLYQGGGTNARQRLHPYFIKVAVRDSRKFSCWFEGKPEVPICRGLFRQLIKLRLSTITS